MQELTRAILLLSCFAATAPAPLRAAHPLIGAQVWFAPGEYDQPEEIEAVFRTLAEQHLPLARVSLVWNFIERTPGQWDFTMFDRVFAAAEKHHVRIAATLWPHEKSGTLGGVPDTETNVKRGEEYLSRVVGRYRSKPALDTWIVINEPGQTPRVNTLATQRFRSWLQKKYGSIAALNQTWLSSAMVPWRPPYKSFEEVSYDARWVPVGRTVSQIPLMDWQEFWRSHVTWYLNWIADNVRRIDPHHPLHTNLVRGGGNLAAMSQDLPAWRAFLDTLGASSYPSQYRRFGLDLSPGISYVSDLLRGVMGPKPIWITEMPAGNMTFTVGFTTELPGASVMTMPYSTPKQMAQWSWTGIGAGAERTVFWLFNARFRKREAGQFGMLNFLGEPGDRVQAVSSVARVVDANASFFDAARPVEPPITLIVSVKSMSLNIALGTPGGGAVRDPEAPMRCLMGFYRALHELGIGAGIRHIQDFDWRARTPRPRMAILPHTLVLTPEQTAGIETFVRNGNTLLASGLSGFYTLDGTFLPMEKEFPLERVFGARPRDMRTIETDAAVNLIHPALRLPAEQWVTELANRGAEVIGRQEGWITAVRNKAGGGEAIWVPSPIGMGALLRDGKPLAEFLRELTAPFAAQVPFRFREYSPGMLLRTLRNGSSYVTVIANTAAQPRAVRLEAPEGLSPKLLWGRAGSVAGKDVSVDARDTVVLQWK